MERRTVNKLIAVAMVGGASFLEGYRPEQKKRKEHLQGFWWEDYGLIPQEQNEHVQLSMFPPYKDGSRFRHYLLSLRDENEFPLAQTAYHPTYIIGAFKADVTLGKSGKEDNFESQREIRLTIGGVPSALNLYPPDLRSRLPGFYGDAYVLLLRKIEPFGALRTEPPWLTIEADTFTDMFRRVQKTNCLAVETADRGVQFFGPTENAFSHKGIIFHTYQFLGNIMGESASMTVWGGKTFTPQPLLAYDMLYGLQVEGRSLGKTPTLTLRTSESGAGVVVTSSPTIITYLHSALVQHSKSTVDLRVTGLNIAKKRVEVSLVNQYGASFPVEIVNVLPAERTLGG